MISHAIRWDITLRGWEGGVSEEIWKKMKADSKQRFEFNKKLLKPKQAGRPCGNALGYTLRNGATDWCGVD